MNVLQFVGEGTVANTKETNSSEIFVYSPLLFPATEGGVNIDVARIKNQAVDGNGKQVNTDMLKTNKMVPATWKPIGEPNRLTPPDVMEGSPVALYQFMGSSDYFWTTFGFAASSMRLETIIYGWNAMPTRGESSDYDLSKYYTMTISPRDGMIGLRNSNANGEKTIIDATFNFMEGRFVMSGAQGSGLIFDDVGHSLTYHNAEESVFTVNKDKIYSFAKGGIMMQTDEDIHMQSKQLLVEANNIIVKVEEKTEISSPITEHTGNLKVNGAIDASKGITSEAIVQGKQGVKTGSIDVDTHLHGNGNDGKDTTKAKM